MTKNELFAQIRDKGSFLCVGLDSDINKIPSHLRDLDDPVFEFNKKIIQATLQYAVAYKPNLAFYESRGAEGWKSLEKTMEFLHQQEPRPFVIADAKRGDIGNTAAMYAKAFYDHLKADAVTLSPYMGEDTVAPFLKYDGKWSVILALTSNKSAKDFQLMRPRQTTFDKLFRKNARSSQPLYKKVIKRSLHWGSNNNIMFVVGATQAEKLAGIRKLIPYHFLLVPGIGKQGGRLSEVAKYGMNSQCGLLINASRSIIFASNGEDFADAAAAEARKVQGEMQELLKKYLR